MHSIHFIAIGGAAMHSLAIALKNNGYAVSGSDDEVFEPARTNLAKAGILPDDAGWFPGKITTNTDAVVLGMHARQDNPELKKARELGIKVYSFPEFLYNETRNKLRAVIAGSHGKTTITSMVMHVLQFHHVAFDYLVGSRPAGFENMVKLNAGNRIAVFEGDEYLSSCLDPRPKFHIYQPQLALISGIAWDHINVFPAFSDYEDQFRIFINGLPPDGCLIYCNEDAGLIELTGKTNPAVNKLPYSTHEHIIESGSTVLIDGNRRIPVHFFGRHNMQNVSGAKLLCKELGISADRFYEAIGTFEGSAKRLEVLARNDNVVVFNDFAHSPSKVKATVEAVRQQYPGNRLFACLELHTFSSLNKAFLDQYAHAMDKADRVIVYYNPETLIHKWLEMISKQDIKRAFARDDLEVIASKEELEDLFHTGNWAGYNVLLMSSGNFSGIDLKHFAQHILSQNP